MGLIKIYIDCFITNGAGMKYHKTCTCCWHIITAYTINLSDVMVDAFQNFMRKSYDNWWNWLKKWDIWLKNAQYSNFQNLQYFWIIQKQWNKRYPTTKWNFWYNWLSLLTTPAWMMWWKTLPDDHEAWITHKPRKKVSIYEFMRTSQDQKEKYQDEATKAKTIF